MFRNITIVFLSLLLSCKENPKRESENGSDYLYEISTDSLNILMDKSILKGDTNSYDAIASYYFIRSQDSEFLNYSLIMANKHHYNKAYYNVHFILTHPRWGDKIIDSATKAIADHYLSESYRLGYTNGKE
jgi:hypothetical protein